MLDEFDTERVKFIIRVRTFVLAPALCDIDGRRELPGVSAAGTWGGQAVDGNVPVVLALGKAQLVALRACPFWSERSQPNLADSNNFLGAWTSNMVARSTTIPPSTPT
jgi:hypothetical protein